MSKGIFVALGVFGFFALVVILALGILASITSIKNKDNALRRKYEAQKSVVEVTMDTMRKTLMSQYKVNQDFAETFIKVVAAQAEGRKGGSLFKSVTEASGAAPQTFTPEIANKMMNTIAGEMAEFQRSQLMWVDIHREHDTFYNQVFLGFFNYSSIIGRERMEAPKVITSSVSKEAMQTGELDDDILGTKK